MEMSVTGTKFGLRKRQQALSVVMETGDSGSNTARCAEDLWHFLFACTVVFLQKSRADDCDVIR